MPRTTWIVRKKLLWLGLTTVVVTTLTSATMVSMALFTDQATDDSTVTAGTIVLDATKIAALDLTTSAIMPGDSVTSPVTVENTGTGQLRYAVSQSSTNADSLAMYSALTLEVRAEDSGGGCSSFNGTVVHAAATLGASGNVVGDPTQGQQSGDRTLNSSANEVLCFRVSLPLSAANSLQGATTTTTFTFDAEQTANNS